MGGSEEQEVVSWRAQKVQGLEQHGWQHHMWPLRMRRQQKGCSRTCKAPLLVSEHGVIQGALAFWRVSSMVGSQPGLRIPPPPLPRVPRCLTA